MGSFQHPISTFQERLSGTTGWYLTEKSSYSKWASLHGGLFKWLKPDEGGRRTKADRRACQEARLSASQKGLQTPECTIKN